MEAPVKSRNCPLSTVVHFKRSDYVSVLSVEFSFETHEWSWAAVRLRESRYNDKMYLWGVWRCNETQKQKMYGCNEALFQKVFKGGNLPTEILEMTVGKLNTYILIGHVPVRPLSIGHDFPHDDSVAPHITSRGELPVLDSFRCSPSDRNLPSLWTQRATTSVREARPKPDRHSVLAPERDTVHGNNTESNSNWEVAIAKPLGLKYGTWNTGERGSEEQVKR